MPISPLCVTAGSCCAEALQVEVARLSGELKHSRELVLYWKDIAKSLEREITDNRKGLPSTHISPYDAR